MSCIASCIIIVLVSIAMLSRLIPKPIHNNPELILINNPYLVLSIIKQAKPTSPTYLIIKQNLQKFINFLFILRIKLFHQTLRTNLN